MKYLKTQTPPSLKPEFCNRATEKKYTQESSEVTTDFNSNEACQKSVLAGKMRIIREH